jgi:hypothetical protein
MKVYEFLNEVLNSDVPTTTDDCLRKSIIQTYGKNIISGHTSVWQSEIMKKTGVWVVKIMDRSRQIQYHIMSDDVEAGEVKTADQIDSKIGLDCMNIIAKDALRSLKNGYPVIILAPTEDKIMSYSQMAKMLLRSKKSEFKLTEPFTTLGLDNIQRWGIKIFENYIPKLSDVNYLLTTSKCKK